MILIGSMRTSRWCPAYSLDTGWCVPREPLTCGSSKPALRSTFAAPLIVGVKAIYWLSLGIGPSGHLAPSVGGTLSRQERPGWIKSSKGWRRRPSHGTQVIQELLAQNPEEDRSEDERRHAPAMKITLQCAGAVSMLSRLATAPPKAFRHRRTRRWRYAAGRCSIHSPGQEDSGTQHRNPGQSTGAPK